MAANENSHSRLTLSVSSALFLMAMLAMICFNGGGRPLSAAAAGEGSNDALGGHEYPWYDKDSRSVKRLTQEPGKESASKERDSITIAKPRSKNPSATNNGATGGGGGGPTGEGAGSMFAIIVATIILIVLVALMMTFLYIESSKSEAAVVSGRSRKQSIEQLPFDLDTADGDFQSAAEAAYRKGDLRTAIIYLYSHLLVTLDQNGMIRLRKGKTNRQYLREVQRHKGVSGYFQQVMLPFESVFFGDHEMDADQFQQCWSGLNNFHLHVKENAEVLIG